ncbi:MAG: HEAT repeat domain-containing protein [Methanomicrobiales archaeon]|nr:HEAT repeat domain-containing protein [Methanomicrobiales archaeon]
MMFPSHLPSIFRPKKPDIQALKSRRDIPGLIAALRYPDLGVQWEATAALGSLGPEAIEYLVRRLPSSRPSGRSGTPRQSNP